MAQKKKKRVYIAIMVGRSENCECSDCPVLYGADCPTSMPNKVR